MCSRKTFLRVHLLFMGGEIMSKTVIVIDPGHGGANEGALWEGYVEKEINMKVANSMKEELEKYEDVTVYLTHEDDRDMSLEERAEFARSVNADFIACLHFNMSEYHTLYGTECWISAYGDCYAKGNDFAKIQNEILAAEGIHNRGVKTRLGKKGDYYGLIRHATARDIPSCIIEHCHLDHIEDAPFVNADTWLERYGKLDATAIAKYFGLKSQVLGVDYSDKNFEPTVATDAVMGHDTTEPEECQILDARYSPENDSIFVEVAAKESDSMLCYYTYSIDGGANFCELKSWKENTSQMTIEIPMPDSNNGSLIICAYNNYDLGKQSEPLDITHLFAQKEQYLLRKKDEEARLKEEQAEQAVLQFTVEEVPLSENARVQEKSIGYGIVILLVLFLLIVVLFARKLRRK